MPVTKKILVIGGGITGISAAIDAAKAGYEVTIVEKEAALGGNAAEVAQAAAHGLPLRKTHGARDPVQDQGARQLPRHPRQDRDRRGPHRRPARGFQRDLQEARRQDRVRRALPAAAGDASG
ncbi:MAG: FAD-dependent oxidoreductase [Desulfosudis oleivorans]|nr:FAD-dependent oxidoreductase [Desulfosudis oleivorans]